MRLIDADALIEDIREHSESYFADDFAHEWVDAQPTIEPERKPGKWIDNHTTCSECGWQMIDDVTESPNMVGFNFCPNCGADMRGEQDK